MTRRWIGLVTLCLTVGLAAQVFAKDVCLTDGFNNTVFKKPKKLKPGDAAPLTGFQYGGGTVWPLAGTAMMKADGTIVAGYFGHGVGASEAFDFTARWTAANNTLAGSGTYDNSPFGSTGTFTFTSVDCKTLTLP